MTVLTITIQKKVILQLRRASAIAALPESPIILLDKSILLTEVFVLSASANATAPESPILLQDKLIREMEVLAFSASASITAPKAPISLLRKLSVKSIDCVVLPCSVNISVILILKL